MIENNKELFQHRIFRTLSVPISTIQICGKDSLERCCHTFRSLSVLLIQVITPRTLGKFLGSSTNFLSMEATSTRSLKRAFFWEDKISLIRFFPSRKGFSFLGSAAVRGVVRRGDVWWCDSVPGGGVLWGGVLSRGVLGGGGQWSFRRGRRETLVSALFFLSFFSWGSRDGLWLGFVQSLAHPASTSSFLFFIFYLFFFFLLPLFKDKDWGGGITSITTSWIHCCSSCCSSCP